MIGLGAPIATPVGATRGGSSSDLRSRLVRSAAPERPRSAPIGAVARCRPPDRGTSGGVEYTVRAARITDIDRFVALSGGRIGARGSRRALCGRGLLQH